MQNSENNQQKYQNMVQRNYLSLNHDQNITDLQFLCQFSTSVIQLSVFNCDNITFTVAPQFITELIINHQQPIDFTGIKLMKLKKLICTVMGPKDYKHLIKIEIRKIFVFVLDLEKETREDLNI
ncbi:Hypothetical_protein [Hexamita inflata]|uniref:Hypothetical_protein n=1 Tax=Hexamita inflata TaxID=28002 RepID=A0AA86NHG2_9EUKA|nr:Hypothetical protein HINF_LOCUS6920 [Hexamita inflata]